MSQSLPQIKQMYSGESFSSFSDENSPSVAHVKISEAKVKQSAFPRIAGKSSPRVQRRHTTSNGQAYLTPSEAIAKYRRILTKFELKEIKDFAHIWFVGPTARKISGSPSKGANDGYDDDKARYRCIKNDHLAYRYEILKGLGKGSFGDVVKAYDHKTKTNIAVKIIRNEPRFHQQAKSEIKILNLLRRQDRRAKHNVIHLKDTFHFRNHLCLTFEMLHSDLYAKLRKEGFKGLPLDTINDYAKKLVTALRVLRRSRIIHCDLKPENILLCSPDSNDVKVIDFGSSCFSHEKIHTYIQSRFYRSPEIILGQSYGVPVDMWSLGCIMAELYTGKPLFSGHSEAEQLLLQMEVLGVPPLHWASQGKRFSVHFDSFGNPLNLRDHRGRLRHVNSKSLESVLKCDNSLFVDFIARCLTWDPAERMTPREAAHHPFLASLEDIDTTTTDTRTATAMAKATEFVGGQMDVDQLQQPQQHEQHAMDTTEDTFDQHHHVSYGQQSQPQTMYPTPPQVPLLEIVPRYMRTTRTQSDGVTGNGLTVDLSISRLRRLKSETHASTAIGSHHRRQSRDTNVDRDLTSRIPQPGLPMQ